SPATATAGTRGRPGWRADGGAGRRRRVRSPGRPSASTISWRGTAGRLLPPRRPPDVYLPVGAVGCGTAPGGVEVVFLGFGAFLQSCVTKSLRQFVLSFHFLRKSLTKLSSAFCWFLEP